MTYSQWNENIAHLFFKPDNAGKDIHFYLTKQDLINHFRQNFNGKTDEEIWADFIHAIKYDQNNTNGLTPYSPIQRPLELYNNWNKEDTPPFIAFLVLYIMPLTETYEEHFNATNYYGKVNVFFKKYEILNTSTESSIGTINYQQISHLWNELEQWSIITKNCDLGIFELKKFGNPNWIHVGKPFSQCILPPKAITRLPELFFQSGLVPNFSYTRDEFRRIIIRHGTDILGIKESVIDLIRGKKGENELGQTILDIVEREYNKWNGETHHLDNGASKGIRKNYTLAPLFLQFKINENEGLISFSYRMYSSNDYPEDLKFGSQENIYETNGWSKTLDFAFNKSFEVRDEFNKWIARFPEREVRLFVSAGIHQLSTNYWIETETLSKTDAMYLLCEEHQNDTIKSWGKTFADGNFKEEDLDGLPDNYYLYKILRPAVSHEEIPILTLHTQKNIELVDSLKINFRTFIGDFLPEIKITNADGDEMVYMHYKDDPDNQIILRKKASAGNRWLLPTEVDLNRDFYIKVENENFGGNEIPYKVQASDGSALKVDGINLPKRDVFGRRVNDESSSYYKGSNIINPSKASKRAYSPWGNLYFSIINNVNTQSITPASFNNHCGNMLAAYLTLKNVFTVNSDDVDHRYCDVDHPHLLSIFC